MSNHECKNRQHGLSLYSVLRGGVPQGHCRSFRLMMGKHDDLLVYIYICSMESLDCRIKPSSSKPLPRAGECRELIVANNIGKRLLIPTVVASALYCTRG
jgi:hypothetical protein